MHFDTGNPELASVESAGEAEPVSATAVAEPGPGSLQLHMHSG